MLTWERVREKEEEGLFVSVNPYLEPFLGNTVNISIQMFTIALFVIIKKKNWKQPKSPSL